MSKAEAEECKQNNAKEENEQEEEEKHKNLIGHIEDLFSFKCSEEEKKSLHTARYSLLDSSLVDEEFLKDSSFEDYSRFGYGKKKGHRS